MKRISLLLLWFGMAIVFSACKKSDTQPNENDRVVMVYLSANNNLVAYAYENINQMEESFKNIKGTLLVYARLANADPAIYRIQNDYTLSINSKKVKTYGPHNSSDPRVMKMIMQDMMAIAPAKHYGLILWSHATNWLPDNNIRLKSFGDDDGAVMSVEDLQQAVPSGLDFLIFDACSMASVEVLYELKNKARYTMASPTETLANGIPYHLVMNDLFNPAPEKAILQTASKYVDYFNSKTGIEQSATVSVFKNQEWPVFAELCKQQFINGRILNGALSPVGVQRLEFDPKSPSASYDFMDFMEHHYEANTYNEITDQFQKLVIFKTNTPNFNLKPIRKFSGLSIYIPQNADASIFPYYKSLSWSKSTGYGNLF